ncbi:MAG: ribonuclease III [Gammaproteobacteria bacterium]|nr:ribonuclease III [Gammaproteobacteria bacterium]
MNNKLKALSRRIGYQFKDPSLLELAMTHKSVSNRNNYERLEFLGDSIVNFLIAAKLFDKFEEAKEGQLSRLRARLVKGETLAMLARKLDLGNTLLLGSGELKSGGFRRDSILADAFESLIGAIYIDAGLERCETLVMEWYEDLLTEITLEHTEKDPKTRLQEFLQAQKKPLPQYTIVGIDGQAHAQIFRVACQIEGVDDAAEGVGPSRRYAEQMAAEKALELLSIK